MQFRVILQETVFHTIVVDAVDTTEAEKVGTEYVAKFPGAARRNSRGLVRWHVEAVTPGCG